MTKRNLVHLVGLLLAIVAVGSAFGATTIISDNCTTVNTNSGFALGEGVNSGINPPNNTRLTGTAVSNLRYYQTVTTRTPDHYDISSNRMRVTTQTQIGRFTLSANGSTPFDFSQALGALYATPATPATYDIKIGMRNDATSTARMSFALATAEGDVTTADFGVQLYRTTTTISYYTIQKRIDTASAGVADVNLVMGTTGPNTTNSMINFLIRVTDAGAESGTDYNSRVQVSIDNGVTWIYDTSTDADLPNGFRFDGTGRYIVFDQASNGSGNVFYDTFSITSTYAPPPPPERVWTGGGTDDNWSTADNWGGLALVSGDPLVFNGTTRQANNNDLSGLTVSSVTFNNGGFTLSGNVFTNTFGITNLAGVNVLGSDWEWGTVGAKTWTVASGSELVLNNTTTVEVNGDHYFYGGGTLRQNGDINIGQAASSTANPAFSVVEGLHYIDGSSFLSKGSYRVGSVATTGTGARTILTNGATLYVKAASGSTRVGDSANPVASRLTMYDSTYKSDGTPLYIPFVVGATGQVVQVGGLVACPINFCNVGTNYGSYAITNGTLETRCIQSLASADEQSFIYFENATLRTVSGVSNTWVSGLTRAEIYSGGLTVDARDADVTISQLLEGAGGLTKVGYSTLKLTGNNAYLGNTVVNQGKLVLRTSRTYKAPIQVADSAELGVLLQTAGASLKSGGLTLGNSTLSFDLGSFSNPTAALMIATNLTVNGIVSIDVANGLLPTIGQFVLVDYEGTIGGTGLGFDSFVLNNLPPGVSAELVNNTDNSSIDLNITGVPGFRWTGAVNSDWDGSTENWISLQSGLPSIWSDGYVAEFLDDAATGLVNLTFDPRPSTILVSNNTLPYVWANPITIHTALVKKNGAGSVTRIGAGADEIATLELNAGSYIVSNETAETFSAVLKDTTAGTGTFVKRGAGTLTISAGNANDTYIGKSIIQEGIVLLGDTRALGATTATIIITNGGTLELDDHQPVQPVIVSGAGVNGQGAIIDSTTNTATEYNLRDVTMTGDTTFGCLRGRWDLRANGGHGPGPGLRGNGYKLTKVGAGHVSIANQRTTTGYWEMNLGDVLIKEGTLTFAESLTPGNPSAALAIYPGASLNVYDLGITNPLLRNITMTNAMIQGAGTPTDTNIFTGTILMSGNCRFYVDEAHLIINGAISGSASVGFNANGPGTLLLNGANSYTGDTTVTNGTLGGTGVLAGNLVMLGGTNAPGSDGVGTLTVNGNVTLAGTTRMELNRSLSPNSDRLVAGGTLAFGGVLQVVLGAGAPAPQAGDVYHLFNKGSSTAFTPPIQLPDLSGLPGGLSWDTSNLAVDGTISVTGSAVPPPPIGTVGLSGSNFTLSGTGGVEGSGYVVVSSPDVTVPLANWLPVATGVYGTGGSFSFTTNVVDAGPRVFYTLRNP